MVVRLRLARFGRHKLPFYRMVAVDSRVRRDGKPLEVVGTWNPLPDKFGAKHLRLNMERVKYWVPLATWDLAMCRQGDDESSLVGCRRATDLHRP